MYIRGFSGRIRRARITPIRIGPWQGGRAFPIRASHVAVH